MWFQSKAVYKLFNPAKSACPSNKPARTYGAASLLNTRPKRKDEVVKPKAL